MLSRRPFASLLGGVLLITAVAVIGVPLLKHAAQELELPLQHEDIIRQQASKNGLDPALVAAVIYAETRFQPRPSPAGAQGLMQILPSTARLLAQRSGGTRFVESDLATPQINIAYGCYYLRYLFDRFGGSEVLALAAYNGGETNVDRWLAQAHAANVRFTVDSIPFAETRAYVRRVETAQKQYAKRYGL